MYCSITNTFVIYTLISIQWIKNIPYKHIFLKDKLYTHWMWWVLHILSCHIDYTMQLVKIKKG